MNVTLNEAGISAFFEAEGGPVATYIAGLAAAVTTEAQANARRYFGGAPSLTIEQDIGFSMEGADAIIGIQNAGSKSRRLARYQAEGRVNWLLDALRTVASS